MEPVLRRLSGVNPRAMLRFSLGALVYAALLLTEGIGLLMVQRWAEYLTIAITASLVPLEVYELARHPNVTRTTLLAMNLAIVIYLVVPVPRFSKLLTREPAMCRRGPAWPRPSPSRAPPPTHR